LDNVVASGSKDKTVRLWLPTVEAKSTVIKAHGGAVRTIGFSHDGQFLLTGSDDKTIKVHLLFILFARRA
jgi:centriolar protein POC1